MIKSKRSMQFIATFVMMLFLFQFFAPLVEIGTAHTPKECEKLYDKWDKKRKKATQQNTKLKDLEKNQVYNIVKEALRDATMLGLFTGGVSWATFRKGLKEAFKKAGLPAFAVTSLVSLINNYRETQDEIDKVKAKRDAFNKEARELWEKYLKCMDHEHASGSLIPYMDSPTTLAYGDTHYALYQANTPYYAVYWYVKGPDETGYGTLMSTDMGDGSKMSSTFSWTAPHKVGSYQLTAHVYFTDTILDSTYYISVF